MPVIHRSCVAEAAEMLGDYLHIPVAEAIRIIETTHKVVE